MRALVAIAMVAACGDDVPSEKPVPPASACTITAADLLAPTEEKTKCIRTTFTSDHARAAALLNELDWTRWKETSQQLGTLPVDDRSWYVVALEPSVKPRVALSALQIARRTKDSIFGADIDLATIDIAMRANDESTANTAIQNLLANDDKLGTQKAQLLTIVAARRERERIFQLCAKQNEAAIAWRCLELVPSWETLAAVGRLPGLSYRDLDKLAPVASKLAGLRCKTERAGGLRSMFERVGDSQQGATPEAVTIYSRLALDAPRDQHVCFLEEAARGCLWLIRNGRACPILDSVARYVAVLPDADRRDAFRAVFEGKNTEYRLLYNPSQAKQAGANLFHLHVLLGEMLVSANVFPTPDEAYKAPYYHVIRAWRFWDDVTTPSVSFEDMISPALRKTFCADRSCRKACELTWVGEPRNCPAACETVREKLSCAGS